MQDPPNGFSANLRVVHDADENKEFSEFQTTITSTRMIRTNIHF